MDKYFPPESIRPLLDRHSSIFRFRRALRRADQTAFDDLLSAACTAAAESGSGPCALVEQVLLAALLAEQKQLDCLKDGLQKGEDRAARAALAD